MRILIVEDDKLLSDGLTRPLRQVGYVVDSVATGEKAVLAAAFENYDVIILDIGLPDIDGFEVLRRMRRNDRYVPVLFLTARDEIENRVRGLDLGADDYLVKPFALDELEARLRALMRRGQATRTPQITCGALVIDMARRQALLHGERLDLTQREWGVLEFMLRHIGQVVSKEQIVEALCDWSEELTLNAVEVYMSRLRTKLEGAGIKIRTVRGFGYLLEEATK